MHTHQDGGDGNDDTPAGSSVAMGRYGHAAAFHGGYMYEFGGFVEIEEAMTGADVGESERGLILGGLRVSYLAEGHDGRLCPVWIETV